MQQIKLFFAVMAVAVVAAVAVFTVKVAALDRGELQASGIAALNSSTGWQWYVDGHTDIQWGLRPAIALDGIMAENIHGGYFPLFIEIGRIEIKTGWLSLLTGKIAAPDVTARDVTVFVESDESGHTNWRQMLTALRAAGNGDRPNPASIPRTVTFQRIAVIYRSGWGEVERRYDIDRVQLKTQNPDKPIKIALETMIAERPLSMHGHLGSIQAMTAAEDHRIAIDGSYDGEKSDATVSISGDVGLGTTALEIAVSADSLNEIDSISGIKLPRDTPVSIRISAADKGDGLVMEDYVLRLGQAIIRPSAL